LGKIVDLKVQGIFARPDWVNKETSLWQQVNEKIASQETQKPQFKLKESRTTMTLRRWSWAAGAVVLIIIGISILSHKHSQRNVAWKAEALSHVQKSENQKAGIVVAEVGGRTATAYIYQTRIATYIWFAPAKKAGG
jgi:hypothetical protein